MTDRRIAELMGFVAATLVVMSALHLAGATGEGPAAGIPEALIAVVLAVGALALGRGARGVALGAVVFAVVGFGIGLSFTARDGSAADLAYHATMLPLLLLALVGLSGTSRRGRASRRAA
jgi:hypothetical protein